MYNLKEKVYKNDKVVGYLVTDKSGSDVKLSLNKALEIIGKDEIKGLSVNSVYRDAGSLYRILDRKDNDVYLLNIATQKKNKVNVSKLIEKLVAKKIYLENGFARRTKTGKWSLVCRELKNEVIPQVPQKTLIKKDNAFSKSSDGLGNGPAKQIQEQQTDLYNNSFLDNKYISLYSLDLFSVHNAGFDNRKDLKYSVNLILYIEKTEGTRLICRLCQDNNIYLKYGNPVLSIGTKSEGYNRIKISDLFAEKGLNYACKEVNKILKENQKRVGAYYLTDSIIEEISRLDIVGKIKERFSKISIGNIEFPTDMLLSQPIYISESKIDGFLVINY